MKQYGIYLPQPVFDAMQDLAQRHNRTIAGEVRTALITYISACVPSTAAGREGFEDIGEVFDKQPERV